MRDNSVKIQMPMIVEKILEILNGGKSDYAFVVGGCVRDALLGRIPNDWDITTKHTPDEAKELLKDYNPYDKGIEFGTIAVNIDGEDYEITTFRKEAGTTDCRHPSTISFANIVEEDLIRRDFTMNAMAYNHSVGLVYVDNGKEDLENKIIRAVGSAKERFSEDALRMIRAIRQSAQLGFSIEENTFEAIKENSSLITFVSQERLMKEFSKILESDNPENIELFVLTGLAKHIAPELEILFDKEKARQNNPNHLRGNRPTTVGEHTIDALKACVRLSNSNYISEVDRLVFKDLTLRMAILTHDFGKPYVRDTKEHKIFGTMDTFYMHPVKSVEVADVFLKRLRFSKDFIKDVLLLVKEHDTPVEKQKKIENNMKVVIDDTNMRRAYASFGATKREFIPKANELMEKLFALKKCDSLGQNPDAVEFCSKSSQDKIIAVEKAKEFFKRNPKEFDIVLSTNGDIIKDVLNLSDKDMKTYGKSIGKVIYRLQDRVLRNPDFNSSISTEDRLKKEVVHIIKNHQLDLPFNNK